MNQKSLSTWDYDLEALLKQGEVEGLAREGITMTVEDCMQMFSGMNHKRVIENLKLETGKDTHDIFSWNKLQVEVLWDYSGRYYNC
eukprot:13690753-Ditylum_brightwellii.AAC.1